MTDKTGYWEDDGGNRRYGHYYVSKTVEMGLYHPWWEEKKKGDEISLEDIESEPDCNNYERQPIEEGKQDIKFDLTGFSGVLSGWFVTNGNRIIIRDKWDPISIPSSVGEFKLSDFKYDP